MQLRSAEALILDGGNLQEGDRIVAFLTREWGQKRGVARGARRKYSRFSGQLQPLSKAKITWFEKEGRDLVRVSEVELVRPAKELLGSLEGILLASYLAESMAVFAQEGEESDALYRLLDSTLETLELWARQGDAAAGEARHALAARYYEAWLLRLSGIFPPPRDCPACGRDLGPGEAAFLPEGGDALLCAECAGADGSGFGSSGGPRRVTPPALEFLRRIGRSRLAALAERPPPATTLREIETLCAILRRGFLGQELRSYEVMRRTLYKVGREVGDSPS